MNVEKNVCRPWYACLGHIHSFGRTHGAQLQHTEAAVMHALVGAVAFFFLFFSVSSLAHILCVIDLNTDSILCAHSAE